MKKFFLAMNDRFDRITDRDSKVILASALLLVGMALLISRVTILVLIGAIYLAVLIIPRVYFVLHEGPKNQQ
jgi:hypothetical protein